MKAKGEGCRDAPCKNLAETGREAASALGTEEAGEKRKAPGQAGRGQVGSRVRMRLNLEPREGSTTSFRARHGGTLHDTEGARTHVSEVTAICKMRDSAEEGRGAR